MNGFNCMYGRVGYNQQMDLVRATFISPANAKIPASVDWRKGGCCYASQRSGTLWLLLVL